MRVVGEQRVEAGLLLVGEQVGANVKGAASAVERVAGPAAVAVDGLLDASAARIEGFAAEPDDVERVMPTSA